MGITIKGKTVYGPNVVMDGLVLYLDAGNTKSYPGSGTVWYDQKDHNNVTLSSCTYNSSNNGSIVFDGSTSYSDVYIPSLTSIATVEMWMNFSPTGGEMPFGFLKYDIWYNGNFGFNTYQSDIYGISSATISSLGIRGNWCHYVFEMRSDVSYTNNKMYINSVNQSLSQLSGTESPGNRNFNSGNARIGNSKNDIIYLATMNLAVFRVYNRILTQDEVSQNYNALKSRFI